MVLLEKYPKQNSRVDKRVVGGSPYDYEHETFKNRINFLNECDSGLHIDQPRRI